MHIMEWKEEQEKNTVKHGERSVEIVDYQTISVEYVSEKRTIRSSTINHKEHIKKLMQKEAGSITIVDFTIKHLDKPENIGQYGTIKRP